MRKLTATIILLGALALAGPAAAAVPVPANDPFYTAPNPIPNVAPGTVLRSRAVSTTALGLPSGLNAWQVLYRTNDTEGRPEAAVATIVVPVISVGGLLGGLFGGGVAHNLVSYQTAEDGLSTTCAPSYQMQMGTEPEEIAMLLPLLLQGSTVVVPDYEGPDSQWTAGRQAGHAVLDGIRAAERFSAAGLNGVQTQVGMWGYSGGAQATAWASELQPSYAPELNIKGVAEGGVPPDVKAVARYIDGGPFAGVYFAAAVGLSRAYPEVNFSSLLTPAGQAMVADVGTKCIADFTGPYAFHKMSEYTTTDPLNVPAVQRVIADDTLGQATPKAPLYIYHAILDELAPIAPVDALVSNYCAHGARVLYHRDLLSEHISLVATGAPAAVAYLSARFAGLPAPSSC